MINRIVHISVLSVVYFLSSPVVSKAIEKDTSEVKMQYNLDEIEVSAQRAPALYSQVARIISVIERKEIEASPAQNVSELLKYVAGVDVRQRGTEGVQTDVSIRGGTFDQTLILLNGVNITDPQTGHHNLNLPVSLAQIERIEVLEGPAARVYGPNAFSGAINVVTRSPQTKQVEVALSGGSFNLFNTNLSGSFATGNVHHLLAFNRKSSDGYIKNTDFKISNLFYSGLIRTDRGNFAFQFGASQKGFGANSFYTPKFPNQYEATKTYFTSAKWKSTGKWHLTPVLYWRQHHDRFELFRTNPASWYKSHNYHQTNTYGGNLNSWVQWRGGKSAMGVEFRSENILSNVLGEPLAEAKPVSGENAQFTKGKSRNTISVFLEHSYYFNKITLSGGVMGNSISGSNLGLNFSPGVEMSYRVTPILKGYTSINSSLRMPTFTDLYYTGPANIGNPNLKPEKSITCESGLKLNQKFFRGHLVVFYRKGKSIIDWVKAKSDDLWQPQNLTRLNNFGVELQFQCNTRQLLGKHFPEKIQLSYLNNNTSKENSEFISHYVLDNLKHKFTGSISKLIAPNITINVRVVFQNREGTYTAFENGSQTGEKEYAPFWLMDTKINYQKNKLTAFLSANNIFNKEYFDIGNVVQPGRWVKAGIIYRLQFE
ncbi:MAG: TonB-dependent receptor [Prolixibacteraceae bacterium]|nr:TonB-dependent receptor [Prolixibacteraceae bacterium]